MENTLRILVATDNHVGYNERDPVRGDDSWKTFHEIMCLAKERDVDMVLLGGDLFHDNVPTRKSMYNVMRSLRTNCYGDKPCEVEILSDGSLHFDATFGHANYEDANINVAIPVFSIHGNHDDPSGDGHFASLDILEMSGLINYFGRIPQADKIDVRPVLLQKGSTKVALFGLSNVRDERLHRTFADSNVTFYRPTTQVDDWYNIAVVHQNHTAHGPKNYLPEEFLPSFMDLIIWGHEHECDIEPHQRPELGFRVMQPGSSVATSLIPGEAVPKQVAILSITGHDMHSEPIRLKTVRPFVYRDIALAQDEEARKIARKDNHRHLLTEYLKKKVEELLKEAHNQWEEARAEDNGATPDDEDERRMPLPLLRLRVETTPGDGANVSRFEVENPQRFGNRFTGRVANPDNILQLHVKKRAAMARKNATSEELKELISRQAAPAEFSKIRVGQLVQEFLSAQSLTILPQNFFGDAVNQYIDKDDKHAMDSFVDESLAKQVQHLVSMHEQDMQDGVFDDEEEDLAAEIDAFRAKLEEMFRSGTLKNRGGRRRYKPKPDGWDSEEEGAWEDQPAALIRDEDVGQSDDFMNSDSDVSKTRAPPSRARGRGSGRRAAASATNSRDRGTAKTAGTKRTANGAAKVASTASKSQSRKKAEELSDESEEVEDAIMIDDEDEEDSSGEDAEVDSQAMFVPETRRKPATTSTNGSRLATTSGRGSRAASVASSTKKTEPRKPAATRKLPARNATTATKGKGKQSTLSFSASQASVLGGAVEEIEDDDEEDAFEPVSSVRTTRRR